MVSGFNQAWVPELLPLPGGVVRNGKAKIIQPVTSSLQNRSLDTLSGIHRGELLRYPKDKQHAIPDIGLIMLCGGTTPSMKLFRSYQNLVGSPAATGSPP